MKDQVDAENMWREAGRRVDKHAGGQPDGRVETYWWSQPGLTNDRGRQMENGEGKDEEKHCCAGQFLPASCHLLLSFFCLQSLSLSFSFLLSGLEAEQTTEA